MEVVLKFLHIYFWYDSKSSILFWVLLMVGMCAQIVILANFLVFELPSYHSRFHFSFT
jgi:hypothetical protein